MEDFTLTLVLLTIKISLMIYCINKAGSLNRSKWGWGVFSFFAPIIAAIAIQFVSTKEEYKYSGSSSMDWENDEILDA